MCHTGIYNHVAWGGSKQLANDQIRESMISDITAQYFKDTLKGYHILTMFTASSTLPFCNSCKATSLTLAFTSSRRWTKLSISAFLSSKRRYESTEGIPLPLAASDNSFCKLNNIYIFFNLAKWPTIIYLGKDGN